MDVQDLAAFMVEERVNPVPVIDEEERLLGIVTHTDLLHMIEQAEAVSGVGEKGEEA